MAAAVAVAVGVYLTWAPAAIPPETQRQLAALSSGVAILGLTLGLWRWSFMPVFNLGRASVSIWDRIVNIVGAIAFIYCAYRFFGYPAAFIGWGIACIGLAIQCVLFLYDTRKPA